jgi:hypothetical protein
MVLARKIHKKIP